MKTARLMSVMRKAVVRQSLPSAVTDHVSGAAHRVQERLVGAAIDLRAQTRNMDVDDVGLRIEMIVPNAFEQHGARDDLAGVLHQKLEEAEFARLQDDVLAAAGHAARQPVERQVADG